MVTLAGPRHTQLDVCPIHHPGEWELPQMAQDSATAFNPFVWTSLLGADCGSRLLREPLRREVLHRRDVLNQQSAHDAFDLAADQRNLNTHGCIAFQP